MGNAASVDFPTDPTQTIDPLDKESSMNLLHNLEELPEEPWGEWPDENGHDPDDEIDYEQIAQNEDDAMRERVERLVDPVYIGEDA